MKAKVNGGPGAAPWIGGSRKPLSWDEIWDSEAWSRKVWVLQSPRQKAFQAGQAKHTPARGSAHHDLTARAPFHTSVQKHKWLPCAHPSASLDPALPFLLLIRALTAALSPDTLAPSTCPSPTWLPILPNRMTKNPSGASPETTPSGAHFLTPPRAWALGPDRQFEYWLYPPPAMWHWALSSSLSFCFLICKMSTVERIKWNDRKGLA